MNTIPSDMLSLFMPNDLLEHFKIVDVQELGDVSTKRMIFYIRMDEKNQLPQGYTDRDYESKGFYAAKQIQDFPIRGKACYLLIRRRRWRLKEGEGKDITSDYSFISKGAKLTIELSDFLKGTSRYQSRYDK